MPAFSFEKITPPAELESGGPVSPTPRRSAIVRFLDRLTPARLQKSEDDIQKIQKLKQKYREQL
jgi:hypothetical protein